MAKKENLSALIQKASRNNVIPPTQKVIPVVKNAEKKKNYNFSFILNISQVEWLRNFVSWKRNSNTKYFNYSNTDALREGINILRSHHPNLESRPEELKISTRIGRTSGSENFEKKYPTSFSLNIDDCNFIYDYFYMKSKLIDNFTKHKFFEEIIEVLQKENDYNN